MPDNNSIRLNKFISESGICSRREADRYIEKGVVYINDSKAKIGDKVFPKDKVRVEIAPDADAWFAVDLKPGRYLLLCSVMEEEGRHFDLGMIYRFTIE